MKIIQLSLGLGFLFASFISLGQTLDCPIEGGSFKDFSGILYSHHNPKEGAVILSGSNINVKTVVDCKVSKILNYGNEQYSLVLLSKDSAIISYSFLQAVFVKEGSEVRKGDVIGQVSIGSSGQYELRFSYRLHSDLIDPKKLIRCQN